MKKIYDKADERIRDRKPVARREKTLSQINMEDVTRSREASRNNTGNMDVGAAISGGRNVTGPALGRWGRAIPGARGRAPSQRSTTRQGVVGGTRSRSASLTRRT